MKQLFYNFSGGINDNSTKLALGLDNSKKVWWQQGKNVSILTNKGITKQKGNSLFFSLPREHKATVISIASIKHIILLHTNLGELISYNSKTNQFNILAQNLSTSIPLKFANYLNGVFIINSIDTPMYFKFNDQSLEILDELVSSRDVSKVIKGDCVTVFKSRLFVGYQDTLYFSALGRYDDFFTSEDAGYINNFHIDDSNIVDIKPYKTYLAIYKENQTYLLLGNNSSDFAIQLFADKGAVSPNSSVSANNKQYFISTNGLFSLEEVGELNQITISSDISANVHTYFQNIDKNNLSKAIILPYNKQNQIWCYLPFYNQNYLNTILIYDYSNHAWMTREIPQNLICATIFNDEIIFADDQGNIFKENISNSFDGQPIEFSWKSPFFSLGEPNLYKTIEEFFLVFDDSYDNNFNFCVFKNYDDLTSEDNEYVQFQDYRSLIFDDDNSCFEPTEEQLQQDPTLKLKLSNWTKPTESNLKLQISESLLCAQICIFGQDLNHDFALTGIEFKDFIYD